MGRWIAYLLLLAIGVLAVVLPLTTGWEPEMAKGSVGFGIGVLAATGYMIVRGLTGRARPSTVGDEAVGVMVDLGLSAWYDWLVVGIAVFGGLAVGTLI